MERSVVLIALFAALIAALGLIPKIMLTSGVPITAQSMGIMLAGTILGAKRGMAAVALFIGLTFAGLPLLAGGRGGLGLLSSPTVGFIIGFPIAAFVTGYIAERLKRTNIAFASIIAAFLGGVVVLYIPGVIGMAVVLGKSINEATLLMMPLVPGDVLKACLTALITQAVYRARSTSVLARG